MYKMHVENNWHLVDPGDVEILSHFQVDYTRCLVEAEEQGRKDIPFSVVMKLGEIPFMRQDVIACVRGMFERLAISSPPSSMSIWACASWSENAP
jgi:hypothetical protein